MARVISKEECNKRAIEDYSQFSQTLRAALQYAFAANGGAIIALLSCLTALTTGKSVSPPIILTINPLILDGDSMLPRRHVLGNCSSVFYFRRKTILGTFLGRESGGKQYRLRPSLCAERDLVRQSGIVFLSLAALMFIPGSIYAIGGFVP